MNKTEQLMLERIKAANDAGSAPNAHQVSDKTKVTGSWLGNRSGGGPKKTHLAAIEALISDGSVERHQGALYVKDHPLLVQTVTWVDLPTMARRVEQARANLEVVEAAYERDRARLARFWGAK